MIAALTPVDPGLLSTAERRAMDMVHDHRLFAHAGGYYGRPPHRITRQLAECLIRKGLVRLTTHGNPSELILTGNGLMTYGVMVERREQRRHA